MIPVEKDAVEGAGAADRDHRRSAAPTNGPRFNKSAPISVPSVPEMYANGAAALRESAKATAAAITGGTNVGTLMPCPGSSVARWYTTMLTTVTPISARP